MAESFFATLDCELLDRTRFEAQTEARLAIFEWIEGGYNPERRHSSIGYLSPNEFERRFAPSEKVGAPPRTPIMIDELRGREGLGLESGQPSTEPR
jgi:putative transposase